MMHANEHPRPNGDNWRNHATCIIENIPPDVFFPPRGDVRKFAAAKAVCNRCPVRQECLDDDSATDYPYGMVYGIRGGLSADERKTARTTVKRKIVHGTPAGFEAHKRNKTKPCDACRDARNDYQAEYRRRRAEAS